MLHLSHSTRVHSIKLMEGFITSQRMHVARLIIIKLTVSLVCFVVTEMTMSSDSIICDSQCSLTHVLNKKDNRKNKTKLLSSPESLKAVGVGLWWEGFVEEVFSKYYCMTNILLCSTFYFTLLLRAM